MKISDVGAKEADFQMAEALVRWERDGGAPAAVSSAPNDKLATQNGREAVFGEAAALQGLRLERQDNGGTNLVYRLLRADQVPTSAVALEFKLSLDDVETILMNRSPS